MKIGAWPSGPIVVAGAGSIGCFVGGLLAAAGRDVVFLGRAGMLEEIASQGLWLTDYAGLGRRIVAERLTLSTDPSVLDRAGMVLVTVKSDATRALATEIANRVPAAAPVVSLQNGRAASKVLGEVLAGRDVRAGMVPFNVVRPGPARFHRATSGDIVIGTGPRSLAPFLSVPHLRVLERVDIAAVQWGKLLINLNNALNALSGETLHAQLRNRDWRRLMADQMAEALSVLKAARIRTVSSAPAPSGLIPAILRLPTPLFTRVAAQMMAIDPEARTSMAYDLAAGRPTEIDALQGEIMRLGAAHGVGTPICAHVTDLVAAAGPGTRLGPQDMRAGL